MTEEKKTVKPKTGKAPAAKPAKAAASVKPAAKPAAKASAKAPKSASNAADGQVKVTQMIGCIARKWDQEATLIGLGLNKRHRSRVLENTPSVRGMIYKVRHLVKVEKVG